MKYSRYADPMERTVISLTPLERFRETDVMLQPHRGLVLIKLAYILADFGTKTSAVFLLQSTLLFVAGSLLHFLIGLCSSRVCYGHRERPLLIRQSFCLKKRNRNIAFTLDSQPLLLKTKRVYRVYIKLWLISLLKLFRFYFYFRGLPRKYFDNENFQIYGILTSARGHESSGRVSAHAYNYNYSIQFNSIQL